VDECEEEDAREIIDSIRDSVSTEDSIPESMSAESSKLRICLSSRHYPSILLPGCLELWVEGHNKPDIRKYVDVNIARIRFESEDTKAKDDLKEAIIGKASGIFLWVYLVVRKLRATSEKGESIQKLQALLKDTPPTLDALFRRMISAIKEEAE
jgi:ankyrin repeat domain-containing protein 50